MIVGLGFFLNQYVLGKKKQFKPASLNILSPLPPPTRGLPGGQGAVIVVQSLGQQDAAGSWRPQVILYQQETFL